MTISWKKNYTPLLVLEKLENAKTIDQNGNISFQGFVFNQVTVLLHSMLEFQIEISEIDCREMVFKAIFTTGKKGKITAKNYIREINIIEKSYYALPIKRFALATTISISSISLPKKI